MDAVKLILVFLMFIVPWAIARLWWWVWFWVTIATLLGITEAVSAIVTKRTISQQFWKWRETAPTWQKILILTGMATFWLYLIAHLYWGW